MIRPWRRRAFLSALGAASLSWSLPGRAENAERVEGHIGRSRSTGQPLRFVGVYTPHGHAHEYYPPQGDFDFDYEHASLAPFEDEATFGKKYKQHLSIVDGVDLSAGILVGTSGHDGPRVILTGSGADGQNPSLDQYLAVERGLGSQTLHTSLVLAIGDEQPRFESSISYGFGGSPLPKTIDPAALFQLLFGQAISGKAAAQLAQERALGKSVLDFARADLKTLFRDLPRSQRPAFEQHQVALRDIEKRLAGVMPACEVPEAPPKFEHLRAHGGGEPSFDAITDLMVDLCVRALSCDLTRFATLVLADLSRTGLPLGLPADVHQEVAHTYRARTDQDPGVPETWLPLAQQNRYSYRKVVRLAKGLDEAGVLEDSVVLVSSDMGNPSRHSSRRVPTLLVGSAGGALSTGRYHYLSDEESIPNNRILVSLCQAFGLSTHRYGESSSSHITEGSFSPLLRQGKE